MSDAALAILVASIPSVASLVVGLLNARQSSKIHVLVNSNLDKVKADLIVANNRISQLVEISKGKKDGNIESGAVVPGIK